MITTTIIRTGADGRRRGYAVAGRATTSASERDCKYRSYVNRRAKRQTRRAARKRQQPGARPRPPSLREPERAHAGESTARPRRVSPRSGRARSALNLRSRRGEEREATRSREAADSRCRETSAGERRGRKKGGTRQRVPTTREERPSARRASHKRTPRSAQKARTPQRDKALAEAAARIKDAGQYQAKSRRLPRRRAPDRNHEPARRVTRVAFGREKAEENTTARSDE